jgi:periplasmic divalent cation tolerance protein
MPVAAAGEYLLVLCSCPEASTAERIARVLIESKAAACVNVLPGMRSIYVWRGAVETSDEQLLLIKTSASVYPAVEALIRDQHPYELPEVIAVPIVRGLASYLNWIDECVKPQP